MVKFATDGAVLNYSRTAVQATVKIMDVDDQGKPLMESNLPQHLQKEICVCYYIGVIFPFYFLSKSVSEIRTVFNGD